MATAIQVTGTTRTGLLGRLLARLFEPSGWSQEREDVRFCAKRQSTLGRQAFITQWPYSLQRIAAEEWDLEYPEVQHG